ncbi:CHAT domain-containing protein [Streptomyces sp. NPDC057939]|uniref:CHAT domain-containing protein n=1 Tax=Streptomyces sp. NPDC057939 TaxID=3346284 RepID=UPI0036E48478
MPAPDLRTRLTERIVAYQQTQDRRFLFGPEVDAELAEMARTVATSRPPRTARGRQRMSQLYHAAAWVHFHRYDRSPGEDGFADLALAVFHLTPLMGIDAVIPAPLLPVLGKDPDPRAQLEFVVMLLERGPAFVDDSFTATAMALLHGAAERATDPAHRAELTSRLGDAHRARAHARLGADRSDLDRAVTLCRTAVDIAPPDPVIRVRLRQRLGLALQSRHQFGGAPSDLAEAVTLLEDVVRETPPGDADLPLRLVDLATALHHRHGLDENPSDAYRAVDVMTEAMRLGPSRPSDAEWCHRHFQSILNRKYLLSGRPEDGDRAVEHGERALALLPAGTTDGRTRASRLMTLGALSESHLIRYDHEGRSVDLNRAIDLAERGLAAAVLPADRPFAAAQLAICLVARGARDEQLDDMGRAITLLSEAIAGTPERHPSLAEMYTGLGTAYFSRYAIRKDLRDLDLVVDTAARALRGTPAGTRSATARRSNLGHAHLARYRRSRQPHDLDRAVEHCVGALRELTPDASRGPGGLKTSGLAASALLERFLKEPSAADRAHAAFLLDRTWGPPAASHARVQYLQAVGGLALAAGRHDRAAQLLDEAALMLPAAVPDSTAPIDLILPLTLHLLMAEYAIEAHCALGSPADALASAELARGVLTKGGTRPPERADGSPLLEGAAHAAAARRLGEVRRGLASTTSRNPPGRAAADPEADRRTYDEACASLRQRPGLARFLLPEAVSGPRPPGPPGAVVVVSPGLRTGHALIIGPDAEPIALPLPALTREVVSGYTGIFVQATGQIPVVLEARLAELLPEILDWLWTAVGEPVTARVRQLLPGPPPRVWWIPVGILSVLPLHTAGPADGGPGCLDAVVSSYAPTVRGLVRPRPGAGRSGPRHRLVVAVPNSPGMPELPGALREARELAARGGEALLDADRAGVLAALPSADLVHFACHAGTRPLSPSEGALHLSDGTLSIAEISALNLAHADLAYLSACSTGQGGWRYAGEALHLASAFQQAGFPHVVSSLWPVSDPVAVRFARRFYEELPDTTGAAAEALNRTARWMRDRNPDRPDQWSTFVHSGP